MKDSLLNVLPRGWGGSSPPPPGRATQATSAIGESNATKGAFYFSVENCGRGGCK